MLYGGNATILTIKKTTIFARGDGNSSTLRSSRRGKIRNKPMAKVNRSIKNDKEPGDSNGLIESVPNQDNPV